MLHFASDYMEGAHPRVLQRLLETNMEKTPGYGDDTYCESAKEKIRNACNCSHAEIHFLVGGTQANATVIRSILRPYEGVVAAETGHINVHEAGAVEAGGHKILTLPHHSGKIHAHAVTKYIEAFNKDDSRAHMVKPGMVYISQPTEYGAIYTKTELENLRAVCAEYAIPLFLDGARLGYALAARGNDVSLETIAKCCDVFYIGGTKVGALFGEAVVITKPGLIENFPTIIKQQGALLAKGRLLGVQFDTLFTENLYLDIARHTVEMAEKLKTGLAAKGYSFLFESPTNQQFIILGNNKLDALARDVSFRVWEPYDETHTVARFVTSWATGKEDVERFLKMM